jgi:chromosome segregation ATPase
VFHSIKTLVQHANQETQRNRTASQEAEARESKLKNAVRSLKEKRKAINGKKVSLYEELKRGQLSLEGFKDAKEKCNAEEEMLKNQMEEQIAELARIRAEIDALNEAAEASSFSPITEDHLTPNLLKAFVQKVIIHPDGNPEIVFKVIDEFCP